MGNKTKMLFHQKLFLVGSLFSLLSFGFFLQSKADKKIFKNIVGNALI
jgi:hypothetical protein